MFLRAERMFSVSVDHDDSSRAWHLELEVCVVRHRVELCKCGTSEQSMIAAGMTPLKVVLVGLILEGSMPILRTVS